MGVSYTAKLLVGVPGETLYESKKTTKVKKVTKYNEDTGQAYEKEIKTTGWHHYWLGKEITEEDQDDPCELCESVGLEYHLGSYPTGEDLVIGLSLGELDRGDSESYLEFDLKEVTDKMNKVQEILDKLGVKETVKVYLMNQCS